MSRKTTRYDSNKHFLAVFFDSNRLDEKVSTRLNNIQDNYHYIFIETLNPFIKAIKSNLAFDKLNGGVKHDASGASSMSTRAEITSFSAGGQSQLLLSRQRLILTRFVSRICRS